jgi:hypothetical protein
MTILTTLYNLTFATLVVPVFKTIVQFNALVSIYSVLRLQSKMPLTPHTFMWILALVTVAEDFTATWAMSSVNERALNFRPNYQTYVLAYLNAEPGRGRAGRQQETHCQALWTRKFLASCQPLHCKMAHVFNFRQDTKLTIAKLLADSLLFLLMTV